MSYNGSGTFQINTTGQPVVGGTIISSATFNALTADLATGLTTAITKDGQTTATVRIPFAQGITSTLVTDASNVSTGSIITAGGVGIAKKLYVGTDANIAGNTAITGNTTIIGTLGVTGVATFSATPIYSSLTASSAVATDASKALVSVTNTGTGSNVLATSPTIASLNLTTALTLAGAAGTNGQLLTSAGSGLPTWANPAGSGPIGTDLSYVDYSLTTSSAINSNATTIFSQTVSLDGTSELMIIHGNSSAHAVVYNTSTSTFGTPILVRTVGFSSAINNIAIAKISSTAVLVSSLVVGGTALETVVLTISGSTITVGTALATTLAAASTLIAPNTRLVVVGSSYVLNYFTTSDSLPKFRAITVSGSTPSIGSELAYAGGTASALHHSYAHSATILLHFSFTSASFVYVLPISVSGTVLSAGTQATAATSSSTSIVTGALSSSRYALAYLNTTIRGAVVSVAGSVASISVAATTMAVTTYSPQMQVFGSQAFILGGVAATENINLITDTAGVATLGTDLAVPIAGGFVNYLSTSKVFFASNTAGQSNYYQYGISSGSAVLEKTFQNVTSTTVAVVGIAGLSPYTRPLSGLPQSGSGTLLISLRTSAGKMVTATTQLPFVASIDGTYFAKIQQGANAFGSYNDGISDAVCWGFPISQAASTTTVQLRKVTLV